MIPRPSEDCAALIRECEGLRLHRYFDPVGIPTIGYGHVVTSADGELMAITKEKAEELLQADMLIAWSAVDRLVNVDLTQGQVDALTDFALNLGEGNLAHSTLLRMVNAGKFDEAAEQFERWNRAGGTVLPGLVTRRKKERALFEGED
jgi:lysozyme